MAKRLGYRSRAAFKILAIHERFRIFRRGDTVLDLGAAPGGWSQVALEHVAPGRVIAVDIQDMEPMPGLMTITGDIFSEDTLMRLKDIAQGGVDVVLSDMAPNISGAYSYDHARSVALAERAKDISTALLSEGGRFVVKVFAGDMLEGYASSLERAFRSVRIHKPQASRASSSEVYVICRGFTGRGRSTL